MRAPLAQTGLVETGVVVLAKWDLDAERERPFHARFIGRGDALLASDVPGGVPTETTGGCMTKPRENRDVRFEMLLRPSERDALEALAERNDRSLAAELRAALAAWIAFQRPSA